MLFYLFDGKQANIESATFPSSDPAQKMKFSIEDFFSKCDQIRRKLRIWSHLLKKPLIENFIFLQSECFIFTYVYTFFRYE